MHSFSGRSSVSTVATKQKRDRRHWTGRPMSQERRRLSLYRQWQADIRAGDEELTAASFEDLQAFWSDPRGTTERAA